MGAEVERTSPEGHGYMVALMVSNIAGAIIYGIAREIVRL